MFPAFSLTKRSLVMLKPQDSDDYKHGLFGDRLFSKEKIRIFQGFTASKAKIRAHKGKTIKKCVH